MPAANAQYVTSGISRLDDLLGGGIIIGDNVVWYDSAGSLAEVFCLNLIRASHKQNRHTIYVSFDRSPKNLLEKLGPLADSAYLTILDCFTFGKGEGAEVFLKFDAPQSQKGSFRLQKVEHPSNPDHVTETVYRLHQTMAEDVRLVFESLTGMQELWGSEEHILKFYARSCPRLYELNTIAYWMIEKEAHSQRLKAHLNKITQVAIDLTLKRGKTSLTVLKAERRDIGLLNKPAVYWSRGISVHFDAENKTTGPLNLGSRLKAFRTEKKISQTELARFVGVTPSTISQVENSQIYPSLPALMKIAQILNVDIASFFKSNSEEQAPVLFPESEATDIHLPHLPKDGIRLKRLVDSDVDAKTESYLIELSPETKLSSHFFMHKGEEAGYLLSGDLTLHLHTGAVHAKPGDWIHLTHQVPVQWENHGTEPAKLLWIKINLH
ncbi:MAG: helix-turn-helix domain-containing protein [Desulfobacterales bacterium]